MDFFLKLIFWVCLGLSIYIVNSISPKLSTEAGNFLEPIGYFLIFYGLLLNIITGRTLKKYGHKKLKKGYSQPDKIVKEGIFSCMRHPAIFGLIFILTGLSFTTGKLITSLYSAVIFAVGEYFIMAVEERQTIKRFKEGYCEFIETHPPFSPSLKCLLRGIKLAFQSKRDKSS